MPRAPFDLARHNADFERFGWSHNPDTCNCKGHLNDPYSRKSVIDFNEFEEELPEGVIKII